MRSQTADLRSSANGEAPAAVRRGARRVLELIGRTPIIELPHLTRDRPGVRIVAKLEWCNPGGSVKDRAALSIVAAAEAAGRLKPGGTLLDASSGNTAVAYAMIAAAVGYRAALCIPKNANPQVLALLRAYGAEIIPTDPLQGSDGAILEARRLAAACPGQFVYLDQYNNPANWQAHYQTTAPELWEQTGGQVTHFVAGLGTTGTFIGTARRLKQLRPALRAIAVQPASPLHGLEGLKHLDSALVPGIYDPSVPDETLLIDTEDAYEAVDQLAAEAGLLVGPSSGAALSACSRVAAALPPGASATIVTIFPDAGARYAAEGLARARRPSITQVIDVR